jgi:hypothetical protein
MTKFPTVQSKDGRVTRVVTSEDELDSLKDQGYVPVKKTSADREPINSGAEGQRRARQSSTTEGSETNTGSTTPTQ